MSAEMQLDQPFIRFTEDIITQVHSEVQTSDFAAFRATEYAIMQERDPSLYDLSCDTFTAFLKTHGEDDAYRFLAGFLFAYRLLRYGNNERPLSPRTRADTTQILRPVIEQAEPGLRSPIDQEFQRRFSDNQCLLETIAGFQHRISRQAAETLLVLYGEEIEP